MPRYIDAEAFEKDVRSRYCNPCIKDKRDHHGIKCRACGTGDMIEEVADAPTADVREVKRAHWIKPSLMSEHICSNCKKSPHMLYGNLPDYCPWCGADMED